MRRIKNFARLTSSRWISQVPVTVGGDGGSIWKNFVVAPNTPEGFTLRGAWDATSNPTGLVKIILIHDDLF